MGVIEQETWLEWAQSPHVHKTARLVGLLGLAWASLELIAYIAIRPYFLQLMQRNPKFTGQAKLQAQTATQMLPRVVCFVHNLLQVPLALLILLDPFYNKNTIWARDDFSTLVMAISAGYFLYDTIECTVRFKHEGMDFLLHGVFCFLVFTNLTYTGQMHYYGAGFLMWELSTPFIHFRWFLYKIGKENTKLYAFCSLFGMLVFFLCRIVWGNALSVMFWLDSSRVVQTPEAAALPKSVLWFYRLSTLVMNSLNMWWFSSMWKLFLNAVRDRQAAAAAKAV